MCLGQLDFLAGNENVVLLGLPVVFHNAPFRSGSEQSVQGGCGNVDGEPFAAPAGDVDRFEFAALDPMQHGLAGAARGGGGGGGGGKAVGGVGREAGGEGGGGPDAAGR